MHDGTVEALCALQCSFCLTTADAYKKSALRYFDAGFCSTGFRLDISLQQASETFIKIVFYIPFIHTGEDADADAMTV